jgi:hypothetical protein
MKKILLSLITLTTLSACNGGINLAVKQQRNGTESSPILIEEPTTTPTPVPTPDPSSSPAPNPDPTPSPSPSPSPSPNPHPKSRIFVSKAVIKVSNGNTRALFEAVCKREAKKAKISGNFTALVGMTTGKFSDQYPVVGPIYQVERGVEIPVAESFQDLIDGKNNAIFTAACGGRLDETYYNLVWTGNNDFNKPSRNDMNCKNWSSANEHGVVGWMGATGSDALSLRYLDCSAKARVYCIEHQ